MAILKKKQIVLYIIEGIKGLSIVGPSIKLKRNYIEK